MVTSHEFAIGKNKYIFNINDDDDDGVKSYMIVYNFSYIIWDDNDDGVSIFGYNFPEYAAIKEIIKDKFGIIIPYN